MNGILFKPDMIKAIVEGRKTQTRRLDGLKEINQEPDRWICIGKDYEEGFEDYFVFRATPEIRLAKPRYQVGETVYIKEKLLVWDGGAGGLSNFVYTDDPEISALLEDNNRLLVARETENILAGEPVVGKWKWRSPLFMFAEHARRFIKITGVGAERVQEITEEDAKAEGIIVSPLWRGGVYIPYVLNDAYRKEYRKLWNSINAKWKRVYNRELKIYEYWQFPWSEEDAVPIPKNTKHPERYHCVPNPWVFVYSFKRVEE